MTSPVATSKISTVVVTSVAASLLLYTVARTRALSPWRRKRGRLGWTMTGLLARHSPMNRAALVFFDQAKALRRHEPMALGTVNVMSMLPSLSDTSDGSQKPCSASPSRYSNCPASCGCAPPSAFPSSMLSVTPLSIDATSSSTMRRSGAALAAYLAVARPNPPMRILPNE